MIVSKELLKQYAYLKIEIDLVNKHIKDDEDKIAQLIEEGTVVDKVKGGEGGIQGFKIEGFPQSEYDRRRRLLSARVAKSKERENRLLEIVTVIEEQINEIPDARERLVMQKYYLENKKQREIAKELYISRELVSKIITKYAD